MDQDKAPSSGPRMAGVARVVAVAPVMLSVLAFVHPVDQAARLHARPVSPLDELQVRAAVLTGGATVVETFYREQVEPVERILTANHPDRLFVRNVALSLVREGRSTGVDPRVLASVLLVENPWLDPHIESTQGAVGLMQVMPFHAGRWGCGSADLRDVGANICHGSRIFAAYLAQKSGDLDRALLAYNGCVRGENTPDCQLYPSHVYSRAGRMAMRGWLRLD